MTDEIPEPIQIPYTQLSAEALQAVVESFVLREGTDYGEREFLLVEKVAHVMGQLRRGEARIVFNPVTESVDIVLVTGLGPAERQRAG